MRNTVNWLSDTNYFGETKKSCKLVIDYYSNNSVVYRNLIYSLVNRYLSYKFLLEQIKWVFKNVAGTFERYTTLNELCE